MRIALVCQKYGGASGGIERGAKELARRFCREHEVHVYAQLIESNDDLPIRFHRVPAIRRCWSLNLLLFFFTAGLSLRKNSYDIVHLRAPCCYKRGIVSCHGIPQAGLIARRELDGKTETGISFRQTRRFILTRPCLEYNYRSGRHQRVISISSKVTEDLVSICGTPREHICYVPNGVDVERFQAIPKPEARDRMGTLFKLTPDDFVFLFVGNFFKRKGLQFVLPAFARLREPSARLLVVGDDPRENQWAKQTAGQLGISGKVHFAGIQKQVEWFYAAGDAFVFPSLYEAASLALLEAMASGLPPISSRTGSATDLIRDGENGLLLSTPGNVDDLTEKMKTLIGDRDLSRQMGMRARETASRFSWDKIAERTLDVYRRVLGTGGKAGAPSHAS